MRSFEDWIVETCSTTGTGTYSLGGAPVGTSYFTFADRFTDGDTTVCYYVRNADRTKWEKNQLTTFETGTPDTLTRNVVKSTNGDTPVNWTAGDLPLRIYVVPDSDPAEGAITGWFEAARHSLLRFGHWFKKDVPSAGKHTWNIFDGSNDLKVGVVNPTRQTIIMIGAPPGEVKAYAGATAPEGYLLCYGQAISRTTYADLFDAIGTLHGVGDGSTTFNVPDLRGRVIAGDSDMGGVDAGNLTGGGVLGAALGAQSNSTTVTVVGATSGAIGGTIAGNALGGNGFDGSLLGAGGAYLVSTSALVVGGSLVTSGSLAVSAGGSSAAFSVVQPTRVLNYIIKI